jgi:hypothetical protein
MQLARVLLVVAFASGCARGSKDAPPPAPLPAEEQRVDEFAFVSTDNNASAAADADDDDDDDEGAPIAGDFAVKSPDEARTIAEAAVADRLDKKKTWKLSPVMPSSWPAKERAVTLYFYPMAANPHSLDYFQLFSAAYRVDVSLVDGTTKVVPIAKPRQIGTVKDTRPSSLERRELDMAESSLVRRLLGADITSGENAYWGYLKFIHEHPEIGKDLERRNGAFVKWVRHKDKG